MGCELIEMLIVCFLLRISSGMQLAQARLTFIIIYSALAVGIVIVMLPIWWCIAKVMRKQKQDRGRRCSAAERVAQS